MCYLHWRGWGTQFQEDISEKVIFQQKPDCSKERNHMALWGAKVPGRENNSAKAPRQTCI